ncbi:MAG: hypothetical protein N2234_06940 [Planctomycetota bacterium]|nr:hypothetical protein [Planctomycetota bacterium]
MRIVAIDEAGYAPLLGPLVSSRVEFESLEPTSLTNSLLSSPFPIKDSKVLYNGRKTLHRLEQPVRSLYPESTTSGSYLKAVAEYGEPPFYWDPTVKLPLSTLSSLEPVSILSSASGEVRFRGATSLYFSEQKFNHLYLETPNKAELLWSLLKGHIRAVLEKTKEDVLFLIDRLGSRRFYAAHLWELFQKLPDAVRETQNCSEYRFVQKDRIVWFCIKTAADLTEPPVSLASIFSKYLRELFLHCLCKYFGERLGEEVQVSGYRDRRTKEFIRQIEKRLDEWRISKEQLIRIA